MPSSFLLGRHQFHEFCTSFLNCGRRCIFPLLISRLGGVVLRTFRRKFQNFQRHKKSLENRNQAENTAPIPYRKPKVYRQKERKKGSAEVIPFQCCLRTMELTDKGNIPIMVQDERLWRAVLSWGAVYTTSPCAPERRAAAGNIAIPSRRPWLLFSYPEIADLLVECAMRKWKRSERGCSCGPEPNRLPPMPPVMPVLLRPGDCRRIVGVGCHIAEGCIAADSRRTGCAIEEGHRLRAGQVASG